MRILDDLLEMIIGLNKAFNTHSHDEFDEEEDDENYGFRYGYYHENDEDYDESDVTKDDWLD